MVLQGVSGHPNNCENETLVFERSALTRTNVLNRHNKTTENTIDFPGYCFSQNASLFPKTKLKKCLT